MFQSDHLLIMDHKNCSKTKNKLVYKANLKLTIRKEDILNLLCHNLSKINPMATMEILMKIHQTDNITKIINLSIKIYIQDYLQE